MEIIDEHAAYLRYLNRRPTSVQQRIRTLWRLQRRLAVPLLQANYDLLHAFCDDPNHGVEARAASVSHVRGFYRWATEQEHLIVDPSLRLRRPKRERRLPRPIPDAAATLALTRAENPIRQWLFLAAYAGLRACEIAQLQGADILIGQIPPVLIIRVSKGGDMSTVTIGEPLRAIARELAAVDGWCFPKGRGMGGHITASQLQKRANTYLHELGIAETLHQFRHWFGTKTYQATGRDLRTTQELMRHRSPVPTAGYTFIDQGDLGRALDALPRLTA